MSTDVDAVPTVMIDRPKVVRLASTALSLLEETVDDGDGEAVRAASATWARLVVELGSSLSDEALDELGRLIPRLPDAATTPGELRVLEAQLVGWVSGVLEGERLLRESEA